MKNKWQLAAGVVLILMGLVGVAVTALYGLRAGSTVPSASTDAGSVERMFIQEMVPHHQDAIDMADLAIQKAEHPELKELARRIKRAQSEENEQMRSWYREWFDQGLDEDASGGMMDGMGMMGARVDLEELEDADQFDKAFIEAMIPHHRMGIMMARMAGNASRREDFVQFTRTIVNVQGEEIDRMSGWYDDWYGR